jgi:DNA-binding CsgD family transcriptional regulator
LIINSSQYTLREELEELEFYHDRIYQNVYEKIEVNKREQLFYNIAMTLLNNPNKVWVEKQLMSITAYLLKCKNIIITSNSEESVLINLYFAGVKAKETAAEAYAMRIFRFCESLLPEDSWEVQYEETLKVKLELAQCEFICGHYIQSKGHFEEMLTYAIYDSDLICIKKKYAALNAYVGEHEIVIEIGLQTLELLGFKINKRRIKIKIVKEIIRGQFLFRNSHLKAIRNAPIIRDDRIVDALEVLTTMIASANLLDEDLFSLIVFKSSNISAQYGNCLYSPAAYAAYSLVVGSVLGDHKKAERIKDISLKLAEMYDDSPLTCVTYFCIGTFVAHWFTSATKSMAYLQTAFESAFKAGDYLYCAYTTCSMIEMQYSMGGRLKDLDAFLELNSKYGQKMNNATLLRQIKIFRGHIKRLNSENISLEEVAFEQAIEKIKTNENMIYHLLKIQRLYLMGDIEDAYRLVCSCMERLDSVVGYAIQTDFVFYYLLLSLIRGKSEKSLSHKRLFYQYRRKFKLWAKSSPENHMGKYLLLKAYSKSIRKKGYELGELFDQAIKHASDNEHLLLEALGNYLAAEHYGKDSKIGRVYGKDASDLFKQWGSNLVGDRMLELFFEHNEYTEVVSIKEEVMDNALSFKNKQSYDELLEQQHKELESMEIEAAFATFLERICQESKGVFGAILLECEGELGIEYTLQNNKTTHHKQTIDPETVDYLPKKIIRYVSRTYEQVVLHDKPFDGPYAHDDYIRDKDQLSLISIPLKYNNIFAGLLYIESSENHQFNPEMVKYIQRCAFIIFARYALERKYNGYKAFINEGVHETITDRESEVLHHMAEGLSNGDIAKILNVSSSTVKTHTLKLYRKLEVNNRIQAVVKARTLKIIK